MSEPEATFDILLRGGHVIDPANDVDGRADVGIKDGKIAAVGGNLDEQSARKTLDVDGLYVTPGLIDMHTHHFLYGASGAINGLHPDGYAFPNGTTTVVDCGGPGWTNIGAFKDSLVKQTRSRVLAFINIISVGMVRDSEQNTDNIQVEQCAAAIEDNRDFVVGIKSAHYMGPGFDSIDAAVKAGEMTSVPVIVDSRTLPTRPYDELVLEHLRPGDIVTHCYRAFHPTLDEDGKVQPYLWDARRRGVRFDVGHGAGSFVFRIAAAAMQQGFGPDTISTDAHLGSFFFQRANMPITMSKMMALGMPLNEAVERSTTLPAQVIGRPELGTLSVGAEADVAVFKLEEGEFPFLDSYLAKLVGDRRLDCRLTLRAGSIVWNIDALGAPSWDTLGDYNERIPM